MCIRDSEERPRFGLTPEELRAWEREQQAKKDKAEAEKAAKSKKADEEIATAEAKRTDAATKLTHAANNAREAKLKEAEQKMASRLWLKKDHSIFEYIKKIDEVIIEIKKRKPNSAEGAGDK